MKLTLLLIPLLLLSSCTIDWDDEKDVNLLVSNSTAVDTRIFTGSNYTFVYPASSTIDTSGVMGSAFIVYEYSKNPVFKNNINLLLQKSTLEIGDLQAFKTLSEDQVKKLITDGNLIKSTIERDRRGESYIFMHYTGKLGIYSFEWYQRIYHKEGTFYVLTLTELSGTNESKKSDILLDGLSFNPK